MENKGVVFLLTCKIYNMSEEVCKVAKSPVCKYDADNR